MVSVASSRFAILKIEDDEEPDNQTSKTLAKPSEKPGQSKNAKKKAKKKAKAEEERAENKELQSMLFMTKAKKGKHKAQEESSTEKQRTDSTSSEQWDDWKKRDTEFVAEVYESDLQQALLESKIEFNEERQKRVAVGDDPDRPERNRRKKAGKSGKPAPMSLEEFNAKAQTQHSDQERKLAGGGGEATDACDEKGDFFNKIADDAERIITKEQRMEQYRKNLKAYEKEAKTLQWEDVVEQKDKELEQTRAELSSLKEEFAAVKKRNKQLCFILAQGEMKEKAEVLLQMEELLAVRDEMTQQVTELHGLLEQERSKVHSLTSELQKHQKHSKK
ncbi:PREDICTED: G kinase-anchoring protein 1-like [Priapulus caudatus]|uniref:G kinase-anchoring protein 1-like n=1 Tax=Priapulus caudatus TaxID=37621 RepID=A0ABM1EVC5_PRICU|nr:PREDICTED: G kinase-anchoring protein 1-like [Priapulus caudatus]